MEINQINKELYELAFIQNGEYGYHESNWKPSIDEREIEEMCDDNEGNWYPATPLGYRDYKESRLQGIKNILDQIPCVLIHSQEELHSIKREENKIRLYDKLRIKDGNSYVVVGDTEKEFYVVDEDNKVYSVQYIPNKER